MVYVCACVSTRVCMNMRVWESMCMHVWLSVHMCMKVCSCPKPRKWPSVASNKGAFSEHELDFAVWAEWREYLKGRSASYAALCVCMPGILRTGLEQQRTDLRWLMLMAPPEVAVFILPTRACIRFRLMGPPMTWITGLLCISVMSCSDKEIKRHKEIQGLRVPICRDKEIERHKETHGLRSPFCSDKEIQGLRVPICRDKKIERHKETHGLRVPYPLCVVTKKRDKEIQGLRVPSPICNQCKWAGSENYGNRWRSGTRHCCTSGCDGFGRPTT